MLIGWEAAEWDLIEPLLDAGELPHLNRIIESGVMGRLVTLDPPIPPLTWTSVATGQMPQDHGVLGLEEPADNGLDVRPFSSESRRCYAIWNILTDAGKPCHVIGWPATAPAEPVNGVMLSSGWDAPVGNRDAPWPFPADIVSPTEFAENAAELRMHPGELSVGDLRSFIPGLEPAEANNNPAILRLGQAIAIAASRQAVATYLMENEPWRFLAIYFPALDEITRYFIEFHPPKMVHLPDDRFERFRNVINQAYRFHDQMLGRLIELAGPESTVILCSTSGVLTKEQRAVPEPDKAISYAGHHRAAGIFFLAGPNIKKDELIYGATICDVAPTILTLLGESVPRNMKGRPLLEAMIEPVAPASVEASERFASNRVQPDLKRLPDGSQSPAQLAALENEFNLARCWQASGRPDLALPLLEKMHRERPLRISPAIHLIHCYRALGRTTDAAQTLERFAARLQQNQAMRPAAYLPQFDLMRGLLALDRGDSQLALAHLQNGETARTQTPPMQTLLGQVYIRLRSPDRAEQAFRRALEIEPENAEANAGLSAALYRQKRYQEAADSALAAASHAPWLGRNHLQLARCLARLNRNNDALLAIENALRHQPGLIEAHRIAVMLHRRDGGEPARSKWHKDAITKLLPLRSHAWMLLRQHKGGRR